MDSTRNILPFITLKGVFLRLRDSIIFENTYWEIRQGEHWAVIGPNGSGKSTLVKALCGRIPVVQGKIHFHFMEHPPVGGASRPEAGKESVTCVSFDSQQAALAGEAGFHQVRWNSLGRDESPLVSDYLRDKYFGRVHRFQISQDRPDPAGFEAKEAEIARLLGIEPLLKKRLVVLSHGETRKLMIAGALMRNPRLLILENPFTGLDTAYKARLHGIIASIIEAGTEVMVAVSRPDEIPEVVTHVLAVDGQRVAALGSKKEILSRLSPAKTADLSDAATRELQPPVAAAGRDGGEGKIPVLVGMEDVSVTYEGVKILDRISWTLRRGEHWALLGHNGAGKTTLLSLILGDNPQAYANRITLFGKPRGSGETIWDLKSRMGWVSPELHLYFPRRISCLDAVCSGFFDSMGLYRRVSTEQRESALSLIGQFNMAESAHKSFGTLSQGEQRLVLLARALVKQPSLLILDEPCQGLDGAQRRRILDTVNSLGTRQETSLIYVTHEMDELPPILTHALTLRDGKVVGKGPIKEVLKGA